VTRSAGAYLDHAASTPVRPEAIAAMRPFWDEISANPTGTHRAAQRAKAALEEAREVVAGVLGRRPDEIVFTGSGSESDNLAVKGAARAARRRAGLDGVVISAIEHKAVLASGERLAREGFRVTQVGATTAGVVDLDALADALDDRTAVVSVMTVNNEVGTIQPLADVVALVRDLAPGALVHTDAVQAPQWLDLAAATGSFDLVSLSGHKFGGPKGTGVLVRARGVEIVPEIEGGGHEWGLRAGTQNVAGAVGFATALRVTHDRRPAETAVIAGHRDRLECALTAACPGAAPNGDPARRVAGILHLAFDGVDAETLLVALDQRDVYAAAGSSCSSGATEPSHVLVAMGIAPERAVGSIRFSLGWATTAADIDAAVDAVPDAVRALAPSLP
jgi:cysteine desulfurase